MNTTEEPIRVHTDVLIAGGGLGAIAAALAVCGAGRRAVMVEAMPIIGGQVSAQLTTPLDEHPLIEHTGASAQYRRFRDTLRQQAGADNPGRGWVSRLCTTPAAARTALEGMLHPFISAGLLTLCTGYQPERAQIVHAAAARTVHSVVFGPAPVPHNLNATTPPRTLLGGADLPGERRRVFERAVADGSRRIEVVAAQIIDATELGDLLPLTGAPFVTGSEGCGRYGERHALAQPSPHAEQSFTVVAALVREDVAQPAQPAPARYHYWRDRYRFSLAADPGDGTATDYPMFAPDDTPSFWSYRRIRAEHPEAIVLNWGSHDYHDQGLIASGAAAVAEARELTLAFVHWLRTEAPRPGGYGYPELRLAPELSETSDGLALAPYVRESRRLAVVKPVTAHDLAPQADGRAAQISDSLGVAWYHADLHPRVGGAASVYEPTGPFQIPARTLVGATVQNLIMGAKNLGATQIAAAAYRVHQGEWAVGEAAGHLATAALHQRATAWEVAHTPSRYRRVQQALRASGCPIDWPAAGVGGDSGVAEAVGAPAAPARAVSPPAPATPHPHTHPHTHPQPRPVPAIVAGLRGKLVVSCQAQPGEDLHGTAHMVAMAKSVLRGGAAAIRAESPDDIRAIRAVTDVPIIGLWKLGSTGVFITPTRDAACTVAASGADIVAFDCTGRDRPDGLGIADTIAALHDRGVLAMADVSTLAEGVAAVELGADLVSTTLAGYTDYSRQQAGPDLALVRELSQAIPVPVFAEGRIRSPEDAVAAFANGAFAVVVGGAITRPATITASFLAALAAADTPLS